MDYPEVEVETMNVGDWVLYHFTAYFTEDGRYVMNGCKRHAYGKVVSIDDNGLHLERWHMAKITRRLRVFGQRVDHTPFRECAYFTVSDPGVSCEPVPAVIAAKLEATHEKVMRYPTRGQRDYARKKRRKEGAVR